MNFVIYPRSVLTILVCIILSLLIFNVIGIISTLYFDHDYVYGLVPLFSFDAEQNIPTFYSSLALLFACSLLYFIASKHKNDGSPYVSWFGLAIIFIFLSIDEFASIHEQFGTPVRESLNTSGLLFFAWVIPYGAALIVFLIFYYKFLTQLPRNIMFLFILSGAIYISGVIGFEMLSGRQSELHGSVNYLYSLYYTCEELLEMLGIAIFIYTLLVYIVSQFKPFTITLDDRK